MIATPTAAFASASSLNGRIAARVRALMAARRVTNKNLADCLHLSPRAATRRRLGEYPFSIAEVEKVAALLKVDPQVILSGRDFEMELAS